MATGELVRTTSPGVVVSPGERLSKQGSAEASIYSESPSGTVRPEVASPQPLSICRLGVK